ncbi:MAG: molecular chaperone DnaJ [Pseudomonadota bacterium]
MGVLAVALAAAAAVWSLYLSVRDSAKRGLAMKLVVWFALSAVAFAAKLWPIAMMLLLGAGAVALIEQFKPKLSGDEKKPSPTPGRMSLDDARAVLGVNEKAGPADIDAAYKRLIARMHPDGGGSDYLAAQINEARDVLKRALKGPNTD